MIPPYPLHFFDHLLSPGTTVSGPVEGLPEPNKSGSTGVGRDPAPGRTAADYSTDSLPRFSGWNPWPMLAEDGSISGSTRIWSSGSFRKAPPDMLAGIDVIRWHVSLTAPQTTDRTLFLRKYSHDRVLITTRLMVFPLLARRVVEVRRALPGSAVFTEPRDLATVWHRAATSVMRCGLCHGKDLAVAIGDAAITGPPSTSPE